MFKFKHICVEIVHWVVVVFLVVWFVVVFGFWVCGLVVGLFPCFLWEKVVGFCCGLV